MGQTAGAIGVLKALDCSCLSDCAKYVCNSGRLRSKCCGCFELSLETDEISVTSGDDEHLESVSIHFPGYTDSEKGCFKWIKK